MKPMNLIATLIPLIIVAVGLIGWVTTLRSDLTAAKAEIVELKKGITPLQAEIDELTIGAAIANDQMQTIMSDHSGFADVLKELGQAGVLPSGERRAYGGYSTYGN